MAVGRGALLQQARSPAPELCHVLPGLFQSPVSPPHPHRSSQGGSRAVTPRLGWPQRHVPVGHSQGQQLRVTPSLPHAVLPTPSCSALLPQSTYRPNHICLTFCRQAGQCLSHVVRHCPLTCSRPHRPQEHQLKALLALVI